MHASITVLTLSITLVGSFLYSLGRMAIRITVHFQSWARWLMAVVLKYCVPAVAQQYSDIPCKVVGMPFLSTILFPFTLSLP